MNQYPIDWQVKALGELVTKIGSGRYAKDESIQIRRWYPHSRSLNVHDGKFR